MQQPQVRIIGGKWRGRKLTIINEHNLRPTPDRIRETVFNWLAAHMSGAFCLDLFAGTGAFAFEAASRGAAQVIAVEQKAAIGAQLKLAKQHLAAENVELWLMPALEALTKINFKLDVVFLDPPYAQNLVPLMLQQLHLSNNLSFGCLIYCEHNAKLNLAGLNNFDVVKSKQAGNIYYYLLNYTLGN
jgi:16S rRNA (guanine(966)-N(2))-methyltransferase RsmD